MGDRVHLVVEAHDSTAARRILTALPQWFGDPDAVDQYVRDAADEAFRSLLALDGDRVVGLALVGRRFRAAGALHLLAVDPHSHGTGAGSALVEHAAALLEDDGAALMSVHTVGPSFADDFYARTRAFYAARGFLPLEEHVGLDWWGPTVIMVRVLNPRAPSSDGRPTAG